MASNSRRLEHRILAVSPKAFSESPTEGEMYQAMENAIEYLAEKNQVGMDFGTALQAMRMGHYVRRLSWPADQAMLVKQIEGFGEIICIDRHARIDTTARHVPITDILATDWELAD